MRRPRCALVNRKKILFISANDRHSHQVETNEKKKLFWPLSKIFFPFISSQASLAFVDDFSFQTTKQSKEKILDDVISIAIKNINWENISFGLNQYKHSLTLIFSSYEQTGVMPKFMFGWRFDNNNNNTEGKFSMLSTNWRVSLAYTSTTSYGQCSLEELKLHRSETGGERWTEEGSHLCVIYYNSSCVFVQTDSSKIEQERQRGRRKERQRQRQRQRENEKVRWNILYAEKRRERHTEPQTEEENAKSSFFAMNGEENQQ